MGGGRVKAVKAGAAGVGKGREGRREKAARTAGRAAAAGAPSTAPSDDWVEISAEGLGTSSCVAEDGLLSIVGFGSLLSKKSALTTFPDLSGFRQCRLRGFRRVFAHTTPIFFARGIARGSECASLSVEPLTADERAGGGDATAICVTQFEIPSSPEAIEAWIEREHEYRFVECSPEPADAGTSPRKGVVCSRYSDEEYRKIRCKSEEEYHRRYGQYGIQQIWDVPGILPCRLYLRHCVLAAQNLGPEAYDNFADSTFLADRSTSIRAYLAANESIMTEDVPPELLERYGG